MIDILSFDQIDLRKKQFSLLSILPNLKGQTMMVF